MALAGRIFDGHAGPLSASLLNTFPPCIPTLFRREAIVTGNSTRDQHVGPSAWLLRGTLAGIAGGVAWRFGLLWIFGPAQPLLADANRQSAKMLGVFAPGPDGPRMYADPRIVWVGLILIALTWGWWYAWLSRSWSGAWWWRGVRFGALAWTLMVPWFEFYLPWNVLREPAELVLLEMACWAGVMAGVGLAIAAVDALATGVAIRQRAASI